MYYYTYIEYFISINGSVERGLQRSSSALNVCVVTYRAPIRFRFLIIGKFLIPDK